MKTQTWFLGLALMLPQLALADALETLSNQTTMDALTVQLKDVRKTPQQLNQELLNGNHVDEILTDSQVKDRWNKKNKEGKVLINELKGINIENIASKSKACKSLKNTVHSLRDAYVDAANKVTDINLSNPDLVRGFACFAFGGIGSRPHSNCIPAFSKDAMKLTVGSARMRVLRRQLDTARFYYLLGLDSFEGSQWNSRDNIAHTYEACQPSQPTLTLARIDLMRKQFKKIEDRLTGIEGKIQLNNVLANLDYIKKEYETVRDTDRAIDFIVMIAGPSTIISMASKVFGAIKVALNVKSIVGAIAFRLAAGGAVSFAIRPHQVLEGLKNNSKMVMDLMRDKKTFEQEIERYTSQRDLMGQDLNYLRVLLEGDINSRQAEFTERQRFADTTARKRAEERKMLADHLISGIQDAKIDCPKCVMPVN